VSTLCGWLAGDPATPRVKTGAVVETMGRALRVHPGESWTRWDFPGLSIGHLGSPGLSGSPPALAGDGRYRLWMAGEIFAAPFLRAPLLEEILQQGAQRVLPHLDGEYQLLLWDEHERRLTLWNDRFGSLPLYWGSNSSGLAFAGGVRGVLVAPGMSTPPDREALREAVTFGGFRLGDRTQVGSVKMLPGGCQATARPGSDLRVRRLWHWHHIQPVPKASEETLLEEAHRLWVQAVERRLKGSESPGQTLSGGLDSRAMLAEAAPRVPRWTAITYGVAGCDDARYARRAAETMGAHWLFAPLYTASPDSAAGTDWLTERSQHIQATDGLIELVDLMHLESLPLQARLLDVNLSGYIGDAVAGPTFLGVRTLEDVAIHLPYYGGRLGLSWETALERLKPAVRDLAGAPLRYAIFDQKLPQSTNRWLHALRPYLTVRRPFTDYQFFDFFQGLPVPLRREGAFYERFLRRFYPACFRSIPNQKTGLPVLSPPWRLQLARARRFAGRIGRRGLKAVGFSLPTRPRTFTADDVEWRRPGVRERIRETILRPGSLACDIFGPEAVIEVLTAWEERAAAPAQVIGALYVYEAYHRDLASHLRQCRAAG